MSLASPLGPHTHWGSHKEPKSFRGATYELEHKAGSVDIASDGLYETRAIVIVVMKHISTDDPFLARASRTHRRHVPRDPEICRMQAGMAFALFLLPRYDQALDWAQTASLQQPSYPTPIEVAAASAALAGRLDTARTWITRLRQIHPDYHVSDFKNLRPLRRPEDLARYEDGPRKAGLPD